MAKLYVNQKNGISHQTAIEGFHRQASEEDDVRIEGRGVSIRLPFLPTLQRLLFQDAEATAFYMERVKAFQAQEKEITDFNSPVALFNFLLPSYRVQTRDVFLVNKTITSAEFGEAIKASPESPAFGFVYQTSVYLMNRQRVMLEVLIGMDRIHLKIWSSLDGKVLATSIVECRVGDECEEPDPLGMF